MKVTILMMIGLLLSAPVASAVPLVQDEYRYTGQSESFTFPVTDITGVTTTQTFSGLVELRVSGFAINDVGPSNHDAFWLFDSASNAVTGALGWGLRMQFAGCARIYDCSAQSVL